jgi:lysozyme family protein
MTFKDSFGVLMAEEGGYTFDPNDFGGETKFGISKRSYPHLDIFNLKMEQAEAIYYHDFWLKFHLDKIKDDLMATQLLLMTVNCSPQTFGTIVQIAIKRCGGSIEVDGVVGTQTIEAINKLPQVALGDAIRVGMVNFYIHRVTIDKSQKKYFEGWIRRAML